MLKKIKYVFIVCLILLGTVEITTFAYSINAEHRANVLTELLGSLKPGYTMMDDTKAVFEAHGFNVGTLSNACNTPKGPCDDLYVGTGNYQKMSLRRDSPFDFELLPFPPLKRASFFTNLYFINGILDSINSTYRVGTTDVRYSRGAGDHTFISSDWKYADGGRVVSIGVGSSGPDFDASFPRFAFNYMYSVRCVDARKLWPAAPPPTTDTRGKLGCK